MLPPRKPHPKKGHQPRTLNRDTMNGIFFVLRTGCQWNALNVTGTCIPVLPIGDFKSGGQPVFLSNYGKKNRHATMKYRV
ncbi:hypothetical protein C7N83_09785 [Neisseria iguanae]|uniref:Insertion element IS402-like domain-containing protein n=1 Tax=Neisseria iguanae TaxID=90242 RepID=A0A2P7TYQ5_9NEIS|nr:hypothetical protein C7N83_09785 [Neisseria iguanae]